MSTQISLKLSDRVYTKANEHVHKHGYESLQDFIRELLREELFEEEKENKVTKRWLKPPVESNFKPKRKR